MPQVGEYELYKRIKLLGEGSFGKAYLVKCLSDDSYGVVKQVDLSKMTEEEKRETLNEAKILEALNHQNIIRFREVYKTKRGKLCIVMDYADGGDLSARIKAQKGQHFPEDKILDWFTQICLGLKHIHDRKILYRDLKAQNVFLTKADIVKLGDFGIAKVLSGTQENAMTMIGTPYYLSPEIIKGRAYNFKSDIWSLGVLLYELCTLRPPFDAKGLPFLARKIVKGQYNPIPSTYSQELRELVSSLLKVNPSERPNTNGILKMPIVQDRIRRFLSETKRMNEFDHTVLHKQKIALSDYKLNNIKNVTHEGPVPQHIIKAYKQKENNENNQKLAPSPVLQPVINNRKSPLSSPALNSDPHRQINVKHLHPLINKNTDAKQNLPPISPNLQSEHRSFRSPVLASIDNIMPLIANKSSQNNEIQTPPQRSGPGFRPIKESPRINMVRLSPLEKNPGNQSPSVQLPALNKNRFISQSPNILPSMARSKLESIGLPHVNNEKVSGLEGPQTAGIFPRRVVNSSKIMNKREILKGFDQSKPPIVNSVMVDNQVESKDRMHTRKGSDNIYYNEREIKSLNNVDNIDEDKKFERPLERGANRRKQSIELNMEENAKKKTDSHLPKLPLDMIEIENEIEGNLKRLNKPSIMVKSPRILVHEAKKEETNGLGEDGEEKFDKEALKVNLAEKHFGKNNVEEIKDIQAMVSELNQIITNLDVNITSGQGTPSHKKTGLAEVAFCAEEKDEDREDDPDDLHLTGKEKKEAAGNNEEFTLDFNGMENLRKTLQTGLGQEKFDMTYKLAKELVEKDEDMNLIEEKTDYYVKVFPFLTKEDVQKYLFNVFTYVVMEEWLIIKNLKA